MRIWTAALILSVAACDATAQTPEGVWRGRIEDRRQQPIQFELQLGSNGAEPAGRLQPIGRGAATPFFVDTAAVSKEGAVRIEIQTLRVVIEGKLSPDAQSIGATWTQFGTDHQPVQLTRAGSATPPTFFDPIVELRGGETAYSVADRWSLSSVLRNRRL